MLEDRLEDRVCWRTGCAGGPEDVLLVGLYGLIESPVTTPPGAADQPCDCSTLIDPAIYSDGN